ncbi:histidine kinase [Dactylosporangium sp. AC04546]|uniref:sensor histidine kinase n=1 Tax=Dactylosporangium sp. AC04546 TaxID=2862460 RepID=UPI001EDD8E83|nr:histidine kinase [Dactylosporangium sp. AC04546]WVK89013.1 histidine kinase [Dactylosporangium sp. AC04546]
MRWWRAVGLSLVVTLIGMAEIAYGHGPGLFKPTIAQLALVLVGAGALLVRQRYPRAVVAVTVLCGAALPAFPPHLVLADVPAMVALYTLALQAGRRTAAAYGAVAVVLLTGSSMWWLPGHLFDIRNVLPLNYVVAAVAIGDSVRNQRKLLAQERRRAAEAERDRAAEARRQVREERVRIARDLHDVVAHHITLVNAQAGVAHHLLRTDPDRAYQALAGIKDTSRVALDELRATVGLLRADDEPDNRQPAPTFAGLDALLDGFRQAGLDVRVTRAGAPRPLTGTADLAAYRIVQEALTNARKHGGGGTVDLDLTYSGDTLDVTLTNPAQPGVRGPGTGHGMIGMRERAESAGGRFTAGATTGTFVVQVSLPLAAGSETTR